MTKVFYLRYVSYVCYVITYVSYVCLLLCNYFIILFMIHRFLDLTNNAVKPRHLHQSYFPAGLTTIISTK